MIRFLYPDIYEFSVFDIQYNNLKICGLVNILFDIDNTIAPVNVPTPGIGLVFLFSKLKDMGFNICILSNGGEKRVSVFAKALGVPYVAKAGKPFPSGVNRALIMLSATRRDSVIIGDQLFTDVLCGKINRICTVLVKPISEKEEWFVKLKRVLEKPVLAGYLKKHGGAK